MNDRRRQRARSMRWFVGRWWVTTAGALMTVAAFLLDGRVAMVALGGCALGVLALDADRWRHRSAAQRWQAVAEGWQNQLLAVRARLRELDGPPDVTGR
jgi:hypothetical protein